MVKLMAVLADVSLTSHYVLGPFETVQEMEAAVDVDVKDKGGLNKMSVFMSHEKHLIQRIGYVNGNCKFVAVEQ